ncbi:hypothetical protein [Amycolatopsis sp. NPDC049868]|uniref:hypothetical protein n=1 Tax=Amycolatopsis sp. NPDC049868 TaxID=3363934 RepID=UPI003795A480
MSRTLKTLAVVALAAVLLAACAAGPNTVAHTGPPPIAGFWLGVWHGIICPVTFVISLFNDNVGMYEVRNNGGWYDFGFLLGALFILSGGGHASARTVSGRSRT